MKINLMEMPFSRRGSYMALSKLPENWRDKGNEQGLYLRTVHGSAVEPLVARIQPLIDGKEAGYGSSLNKAELILELGKVETCSAKTDSAKTDSAKTDSAKTDSEKTDNAKTDSAKTDSTKTDNTGAVSTMADSARAGSTEANGAGIGICFNDADTILVQGGKGAGICLDFLTGKGPYDYIYEIPYDGRILYMANCYKNNCRYLVWAQEGNITLEQQWEESTSLDSRLHVSGEGGFLLILREIETEWDRECKVYSYENSRSRVEKELTAFYHAMPESPYTPQDITFLAAYLNWSSVVRKNGFLKRDGMFMSKNWMCNVWSWDHCFNAIALSYHLPEQAWEQFMLIFDMQDPTGRLPDSVNDAHVVWNYCKPPIHGWAFNKMREHMELSLEQKEDAYACLEKWTDWWLTYRRDEKTGLCFYNHGNDSGWDNSTVFSAVPPIASPELQAYLVIQMDVLAHLAGELGKDGKARAWENRSREMLDKLLAHCFLDRLPCAIQVNTGKQVENNSLLPYECLILGERLPEGLREAMVNVLTGGRFLTEFGFATESPGSDCYRPDGYWRGPIWAPSTMLLLDGLSKCGEGKLVKTVAQHFIRMAAGSGFAENFDALTGLGLRDRAYTWTSSVFLVMAHEYMTGEE